MLQLFRHCQATDPRNKVFALIGLAEVFCGESFDIDYNVPVNQDYQNLTQHIIEKSQNLEILACAWSLGPRRPDLPTWVADWSISVFQLQSMLRSWYIGGRNDAPFYTAGGDAETKPQYRFSSDIAELSLKGILYDRVDSAPDVTERTREDIPETLKLWRDTLVPFWTDEENPRGSVDELTDCLLRALTADAHFRSRMTPESIEEIRGWLKGEVKPGRKKGQEDGVVETTGRKLEYGFVDDANQARSNFVEAYISAARDTIPTEQQNGSEYESDILTATSGRVFLITERSHLGLAPLETQNGDDIFIPVGWDVLWSLERLRVRNRHMNLLENVLYKELWMGKFGKSLRKTSYVWKKLLYVDMFDLKLSFISYRILVYHSTEASCVLQI
jgi:hypothetical protein